MQQQLSSLDYDDSLEYDEIDMQHIQQSRGPKLRISGLRQSEAELNPMIWAEVLKQDVKALNKFIEEERERLRSLLGDMSAVHHTEARDSLALIQGFKVRSSELDLEMAKWDEEFPKNPTLIEGVVAYDENRGNSRTRTELRQSKMMMMDLLHRPDVLNLRERKQHHLVHGKLGGGIYDPPDSSWDGTRYKNTLIASLRSKLTLKIHFQALAHMATVKRGARRTCDKYHSTRSKQFLKLCFQSLKHELVDSLHSHANANAVARMLEQQKYLYPALHGVQKRMMRARHHHHQLRRAENFDRSWYLIHGFTKVERFHRLSRAAIDSHTLAKRHFSRGHKESCLASLHEHKRLMQSLRTMRQAVHVFRLETVGRAHFDRLSRHVYLLRRLQACQDALLSFRRHRQVVEPWHLLRTVTRELAEERTAVQAGTLHKRMRVAYDLVSTLLRFHRKRQALRKWHDAGATFHTRKQLALAMHRAAGMAGYCLYLQTCMHRGFHFYRYNALQDALSILHVRAHAGKLSFLGGTAAVDWAYQQAKRLGLRRFKQQLALSRRARLISKWAPERSVRARMNKAYQAWIYSYVKRCTLKITLQKKLQQERNWLSDNPNDARRLKRAADWKEEMMNLEHHRSDTDVQQLEHSLVQLRARAVVQLVDSRAVDYTIIRTKLKAVKALSAPQSRAQSESDVNLSIEERVHEAVAGREALAEEEEGLSSYMHALSRHKVTLGLVSGLPLAFNNSSAAFEECVAKDERGVIRGINVGPGVRAGFMGAHASGVEALGSLAESEVRSGMGLMVSGIHKPHVSYTSHMPAHHDSHHTHHVPVPVPMPLTESTGLSAGPSGVSSVDTASSGASTRSLHGMHMDGSAQEDPLSTGAGAGDLYRPLHSSGQPARTTHQPPTKNERSTRRTLSRAPADNTYGDDRGGRPRRPDGDTPPHYLQSTAAAEGWAAGHAPIAPHLRAKHEPHLAHTAGPALSVARKDAHEQAVHHHDGHDLPAGVPHYLQGTTASEVSAAQHPHQANESTKRHAADAQVVHSQSTSAAATGRVMKADKHSAAGARASAPTKTPAQGAAAKATGKTAAGALRGKAKQVKKTVKIGAASAESNSSRGKRAPVASTPAEADLGPAEVKRRYRETGRAATVTASLASDSRLKYHPGHPEAQHQHRVRARGQMHSRRDGGGRDDSSESSELSEDLEAWRDTHDLTQIVSRAELYRSVETSSTDDSDGVAYDASRSLHRSSHMSPGAVWGRDEDEVRADMEAAAATSVYRKMNQSNPSPLMRFFRSAVSLGTTEKRRRPRVGAQDKSDYLLHDGEEEDQTSRQPAPVTAMPLRHTHKPRERLGHLGAGHPPLELEIDPHLGGIALTTAGMDLLERSMDLSVTSGGHAARAHRLEGSFTLDQHDDDARAESFAFSSAPGTGLNTSGISMIEDDDEEDGEDGNDDTRGIMGHATDPHTRALFRDPESRSRRRLEMFEVVGTLDDALRLVTESRWAFSKLRRHARLTRNARTTRQGNVRRRLFLCIRGWRHLHARALRQLELCDAVYRKKALARSVRHLHYHGYERLQTLGSRLAAKALRYCQRSAVRLWWRQTRAILNGQRAARGRRLHVLRRQWASWTWCTRYLPGMSTVRRKVTRRVCQPLLYRWRVKVTRAKKLKRAFTIFHAAWDSRLERTVLRSSYLRQTDVFNAWKEYMQIAMEERAHRKKREMAFIFRGHALTSKCWYVWLAFHGRAQAVKRAALRQRHMEMRLCLDALRNEAVDTRLALEEARHHRSFFLRLHVYLCWHDRTLQMQYIKPRRHYRLRVYRLFLDEVRVSGKVTRWTEALAPEQQQRRMRRLMQKWKGVVIRRMRIRIGLGKLHDSWVRHMARAALVTWPGRASFAKGEAMRRRLEEKGRARIVLVDKNDKERARREEEKKRKREEEERKARSFIQYRQKAPVQQRAQLLGIIYSMDDHHAVANLFVLLRTVLVMWQETAQEERLLRGQERLVTFRHKRFLLEHHLRKWMNRCSATSHRVALWINAKYEQKVSKKMAEATSAIATQRLVEEFARMDVEPGVHTTIGGVTI